MRSLASVLALAVATAATACSSGGGSAGGKQSPATTDALTGTNKSTDIHVQVTGAGKVRLFGTFTLPAAASSSHVPAVLIVPSTGPGDRDGPTALDGAPDAFGRDLATALSNAGVASYRYDRRGTGESKIEPDVRLSVDDLVGDARAGVDLLAQRKETAGQNVSVVGYESGALVALRLAASDDRIKRVVLISPPGNGLLDATAGELNARFGPDSADALRATVSNLIGTRMLPPLSDIRSELRPLLPPPEASFLADLYGIDPTVDAAKLKVPTLIVVPTDSTPYAPDRLAAAVPNGAAQVATTKGGPTLDVPGTFVPLSPNDPALHNNGMNSPFPPSTRDADAMGRITGFITSAAPR